MRDRLRLPLRFDAGAMRGDLLGLEQAAWIDHYVKENYDGAWTVLPLRATAGARHPIATIYSDPSADVFVDTPLLQHCPYFRQVLASFACPLHAVRLMKLAAGSIIKPHRDHDLSVAYGKARIHIPVVTNSAVEFRLNGERVVMQEGECWYLDLSGEHSVANRGAEDRIHLVIDALVDSWLEGLLGEAERTVSEDDVARVPAPLAPPAPAPAARGDLERFRAAVHDDASLQQRLWDFADRSAFITFAVRLAAELGYRVTVGEIDQVMRESRQARHW